MQMATTATFLHVTDTHLKPGGLSNQEDLKLDVPGIGPVRRIDALRITVRQLAERLKAEDRKLDGVLFSGDAQDKGLPNGHKELREVLREELGGVMSCGARFVATPGNHDVPQGSDPGSEKRYAEFTEIWRDKKNPAVTPWLDDIDGPSIAATNFDEHRFAAPDGSWVIYPLNTCNWSHTQVRLPETVAAAIDKIDQLLESQEDLRKEVADLIARDIRAPYEKHLLYDIARVSPQQLGAMKPLIDDSNQDRRKPVRIVLMHHHLLAPSIREELRPFGDIVNVSGLRTYLKQNEIDIVIHGHKHVEALAYDYIYDHDKTVQTDARRIMVISGGTVDGPTDASSMRLITIAGLPGAPKVEVEQIPLGRLGFKLAKGAVYGGRLWRTNEQVQGGPVVINGTDIDDVYAQAVQAAKEEADKGMLIVHLDLPAPKPASDDETPKLPFPSTYPNPDVASNATEQPELDAWVEDLASWWQLPTSALEPRFPYVHGTRLRRFAGRFDQVQRVVALLKASASTSRAIAVLIDPLRDFGQSGEGEDFASFCLVQFRRRSAEAGGSHLDCTAYYRAQEFKHWWPINVAELRKLQLEVAEQLGCSPGRITTIAADARAVVSRAPGQAICRSPVPPLGQAPAKLMALASYLCVVSPPRSELKAVAAEWLQYLADQKAATEKTAFNADGVPVAIDSLEILASYVEALTSTDPNEGRGLAATLKDLARENRKYERSSKDWSAFRDWADRASALCDQLKLLDESRMSHLEAGERDASIEPVPA
jgi:3',5'-cyclic AMP phosphodiesterase CpdA